MKQTTYWILLHPTDGAPVEVYSTGSFNKEALQRAFDIAAINLKEGEELEYGKTTPTHYESLLNVEMTKRGLRRYTSKGMVSYSPKYKA